MSQLAALAPVVVPALLGIAVSYLTALLTKATLSSGLKLVFNTALTLLAAAVPTVPFMTSGSLLHDLESYGAAVLAAWATNALTYVAGGSQVVARKTAKFGLGRKADYERAA